MLIEGRLNGDDRGKEWRRDRHEINEPGENSPGESNISQDFRNPFVSCADASATLGSLLASSDKLC